MLQKHINKLLQIRNKLATMGEDLVMSFDLILEALNANDASILSQVEERLGNFTTQNRDTDNDIIMSLALFGAEATDLRELVAYLKITSEIARVSDNLKSFSKRIKPLLEDGKAFDANKEYILHLTKSSIGALKFCIDMFKLSDKDDIISLCTKVEVEESKSDELYSILEKNVIEILSNEKELIVDQMKLLSVMRKLERIADRASSIAKLLAYAADGGRLSIY